MIANVALPSQSSAYALVNGKIVRHALGGATAIEVFVLLWAFHHKDAQ